jgi:hypothetical protein
MPTYANALDLLECIISWLTATRRRRNLHFCLNCRSKQTNQQITVFIVIDRAFKPEFCGLCVTRRENYGKKRRGSDLICIVRGSNGDALQLRLFYNT